MFEDNFKEKLTLDNPGIRLPEFTMPEEERVKYSIPKAASEVEILTILAREGYRKKLSLGLIPIDKTQDYGKRVKYELEVLTKTNFVSYILAIWKITSFAERQNFVKSYGRGSAAGSLVCDLIGITDCDPLKYNLYFERFISPSRARTNVVDGVKYLQGALPDIDLDFSDEERGEIIDYVASQYPDRFVKLSTLSTFATKVLTGELCKVLYGWEEDKFKPITSQVVAKHGKNPSPEEVYKESEAYRNFCDKNPIFYQICRRLHGCIKSSSSHASAYLISHDPLDTFMPLQLSKAAKEDDEEESDELHLTSCYDMYVAQDLAIKVDLLGIKNLALVGNIAKATGEEISSIDLDSYENIYKHLQDFKHPYGIFQFSGKGAAKGVSKIKPKNLFEGSACSAICRPGAMEFIDDYAKYTNTGEVSSLHPLFDDILQKTALKAIFQEQVMSMFNKLGFTLVECDDIRRGIGKKDKDLILSYEELIYKKAEENNLPKEAAKIAFDIAENCADYSFNASHAFAYTKLSALTVYFKYKYPTHFFLEAIKKAHKGNKPYKEMASIIPELPYFKVKLLPPDLIYSDLDFKMEGPDIRYGIGNVKHVAAKALEKIRLFLDKEKTNKFQVFYAAKQTGLNVAVVAALIQSGCLSSLISDRPKGVLEAQLWSKLSDRERNYCLQNGEKYNFDLITALKDYINWHDGKPFKESRLNTIRKHTEPYVELYTRNKKYPNLAAYVYEKALLGYSYSHTLSGLFIKEHPDLVNIDKIKTELDQNTRVEMVAEIVKCKKATSKAGNLYIHLDLVDESGAIGAKLMKDKVPRFLSQSRLPDEGDIIYIQGNKGSDEIIWVDLMEIQDSHISLSLKELRKAEKGEEDTKNIEENKE